MAYDLHISIPETRTIIELRGDRPNLPHLPAWPPRPNSRTTLGAQSLIWTGPESCLLIAPLADEAALEAALAPLANDATSITNLSDTLSFFTLTGADAGVAMAIACPLDLHPTVFAPDTTAFTDAFGTRALVLRESAAWVLATGPSFAPYVAQCLHRIV
jgi:sarcosine oxidase subunit gamma